MSPFVVFCVDFGHYYSQSLSLQERGIKSHVVLHFLALSAFLTFPTLSIERWLERLELALVGRRKRGI